MILKGKRIFYIEDNLQNRSIVQLLLEQHGATIGFERWGEMNEVKKRLDLLMPVDLILLDLMFPGGVTGYQIFDALRQDEKYRAIPFVAISAADASTEMTRARAKGFVGYISKPINLVHFPQQIAQLIAGERIWYEE